MERSTKPKEIINFAKENKDVLAITTLAVGGAFLMAQEEPSLKAIGGAIFVGLLAYHPAEILYNRFRSK